MNAAIHYSAEAYDTSKPKLMGRHAAGEGFLRGYARHAGADALICYAKTKHDFADFEARVARLAGGPRSCRWIPHERSEELAAAGCLYFPAPGLGALAWQRRHFGARAYSLCGVTHTTASEGVMDGIGEMLLAPLQSWDAVICTSRVVKATIEHVHAQWGAYLESKLGGRARAPLQLPIIPLGVECDEFDATAMTEKLRNDLRKKFGIGKDDVAVLFVGRLSYHAKAHPMPMYLGLEAAAKRTGKRIHLIQAGWFANDPIQQEFVAGAKAFCPSVRALFLDGRTPEVRNRIWFSADIFTSLPDNIQETFGLTPIEAMAAGLPAIVSDWDGYRDTVRNGIEGILVPTFMPPPRAGEALAYRHAAGLDNYDHYVGYASQCVGVDVAAAAEAYTALVGDAALRKRMGAAARARAKANYDWRVVVAAYRALWDELAARRAKDAETGPRPGGAPVQPLRDDPFSVFAGYASAAILPGTMVAAAPGAEAEIVHVRAAAMNDFAADFLAPAAEIDRLLARISAEGPISVAALYGGASDDERARIARSLAWLGKMGLVRLIGLGLRSP
jgi:glycosyltransferase involved in cell wall biosynthesis